MAFSLYDDKTGKVYDAADEATATAQMRAYGLKPATDEQIAAHDLQKQHGGGAAQLETVPITALATTAETLAAGANLGTSALAGFGLGNTDPETLRGKDIAPGAYTDERIAERKANPKAAFVGALLPDLASAALIPEAAGAKLGARALSLAGRSLVTGAVSEGGETAITGDDYSLGDAATYGLTAGALEGASTLALNKAMKGMGLAKDALDSAVTRARKVAVRNAAGETAPGLRAAELAKNAEDLYAQHQTGLDEALGVIETRMTETPERMFTPSALKKTVSDNQAAQAEHFAQIAVQLQHAADVSGAVGSVGGAARIMESAVDGSGPNMFRAIRDARAHLGSAAADSPLAREALDALDNSLRNEAVWGRAAKNYAHVADPALGETASKTGRAYSVKDLAEREALEARLDAAESVATATKDKKMAAAVKRARRYVADADEVTGARVMGDPIDTWENTPKGRRDRQRATDDSKTLWGKAKNYANTIGEEELGGVVESALKTGAMSLGSMVAGGPGLVGGYLLAAHINRKYGSKITEQVWKSTKAGIAAAAKSNPAAAVGALGGAMLGGAPLGKVGAMGGAYLGAKGAQAVEGAVRKVTGKGARNGEASSRRIWNAIKTGSSARKTAAKGEQAAAKGERAAAQAPGMRWTQTAPSESVDDFLKRSNKADAERLKKRHADYAKEDGAKPKDAPIDYSKAGQDESLEEFEKRMAGVRDESTSRELQEMMGGKGAGKSKKAADKASQQVEEVLRTGEPPSKQFLDDLEDFKNAKGDGGDGGAARASSFPKYWDETAWEVHDAVRDKARAVSAAMREAAGNAAQAVKDTAEAAAGKVKEALKSKPKAYKGRVVEPPPPPKPGPTPKARPVDDLVSEAADELSKIFNEKERKALGFFADPERSAILNNFARLDPRAYSAQPGVREIILEVQHNIDKAIKKATRAGGGIEGTFYRGVGLPADMLEGLVPGAIIADAGFTTATSNEARASVFARTKGQGAGQISVVLKVDATNAVPFAKSDVIFKRGTAFQVVNVDKSGPFVRVTVKELDEAAKKTAAAAAADTATTSAGKKAMQLLADNPTKVAGAGLAAVGTADAVLNPDDQGAGAAGASVGLLAMFLPQGGRRVLAESLDEAMSALATSERFALNQAARKAATKNEELLRSFARKETGEMTANELMEQQYRNIAEEYGEIARDAAPSLEDTHNMPLKKAIGEHLYYHNAAVIENNADLLRLAEVGRFDALPGGGQQAMPFAAPARDLERFGLPSPADTAIREGPPVDIRGHHVTRSQIDRFEAGLSRRLDAAEEALTDADMPPGANRVLNDHRNYVLSGANSYGPMEEAIGHVDGVVRNWAQDFEQAVGRAPNERELAYAKANLEHRAGGYWAGNNISRLHVREHENRLASAAAERADTQAAWESRRNALVDARDNARNALHNDDMPTTAAGLMTDEHFLMHESIDRGMSRAQVDAQASSAAERWADTFEQELGRRPNEREIAYAEASLQEEAHRIHTQMSGQGGGGGGRPPSSAPPSSAPPSSSSTNWRDEWELADEGKEAWRQELDNLSEQLVEEGERGFSRGGSDLDDHQIDSIIERVREQSMLDDADEVFLRQELGQGPPDFSDVDDWIEDGVSTLAGYADDGAEQIDADDVIRMINNGETRLGNHTVTPWEEYHIRSTWDDHQSAYHESFQNRFDELNGPSSSEPPSSGGYGGTSRPTRGQRHPDVEDGLPHPDDLEAIGFTDVAMHDAAGMENVFGPEPVTTRDLRDMLVLGPLKKYADDTGIDLEAKLEVLKDSVRYEAEAGDFQVTSVFEPGANGVKVNQKYMKVPPELQGQGVMRKFVKPMIEAFERRGAESVTVDTAIDVGRHAWPALGLRPPPEAERAALTAYGAFLEGLSEQGAKNVAEGMGDAPKHIRDVADATLPISSVEALIPAFKMRYEQLAGRSSIGDAGFEKQFITGDRFRTGKAFLLSNSGPWNHDLKIRLDRNDPWYRDTLARLGLLGAAGLTGYEAIKTLNDHSLEFGDAGATGEAGAPAENTIPPELHAELVDQMNEAQEADAANEKLAYLKAQKESAINTAARAVASPASNARTVPRTPGVTNSIGVASFMGSNATLQGAYAEKKDTLAKLQGDPMMLVDEMSESLASLEKANPALHKQVAAQTFKVAQYLQSKLPGTIGASLTRPEGSPPSGLAVRQFALYYSAATDPSSVLGDLTHNRAQKEQVDTLRELWPDTYNDLKSSILDNLSKGRPTLAQRQRMDLLFDFGEALDTGLSNRLVATHDAYRAEQAQGKGPGGAQETPGAMPTRRSQPTVVATSPLASLSQGAAKGVGAAA